MKQLTAVPVLAIGLSGCVANFAPTESHHADFHYTYTVEPKLRVDAESFNGEIVIEGWDRDDVEVTGMKSAATASLLNEIKIDVHNTPGSFEIRAIKPSAQNGNVSAKFTMHVPRGAQLGRVTTSNARIQVSGVDRAAHLKTTNGSVSVNGVHGDVDARTTNASIEAVALDGAVSLKSSNGSIRAEKISGPFEAETSNSSINARLSASPETPVKLITSNGSVDLTMEKAPKGDVRVVTTNSPITVHLPSDTSARITADTSNASVSCEFDVAGEKDKTHIKGNIGAGGHTIELSTGNGSIRVVKSPAK